ncbi:CASP-like protein 4D [Parasponia andersonii]|uniref:CASP-like protein n=1 Tax=Parasponia andersonii TaxID=3476 RepID=A0A2P5BQI2_PARAD|nr:CASP-like protein 4D [Parasponia andersonii]
MAKSTASKIASLVLRVFTLVLLLIALIILCTNTKIIEFQDGDQVKFRFQDFFAYRYVLSTIVIGTAYAILQLALTIYTVVSNSEGIPLFDFYGDKIMSYLLATGAGAGFGMTNDMKRIFDLGNFYDKSYAATSLLLLAFICTAIMSYLLATGAGAGFGMTNDMKRIFDLGNFYDKSYAATSLLLLAFICTAVLSVLSSYALPKTV